MPKLGDLAFKTTTGFLGICTILFGANLIFNTGRGMAWHLENSVSELILFIPTHMYVSFVLIDDRSCGKSRSNKRA